MLSEPRKISSMQLLLLRPLVVCFLILFCFFLLCLGSASRLLASCFYVSCLLRPLQLLFLLLCLLLASL